MFVRGTKYLHTKSIELCLTSSKYWPPTPLSNQRVCSPPKAESTHSPGGEGVGGQYLEDVSIGLPCLITFSLNILPTHSLKLLYSIIAVCLVEKSSSRCGDLKRGYAEPQLSSNLLLYAAPFLQKWRWRWRSETVYSRYIKLNKLIPLEKCIFLGNFTKTVQLMNEICALVNKLLFNKSEILLKLCN